MAPALGVEVPGFRWPCFFVLCLIKSHDGSMGLVYLPTNYLPLKDQANVAKYTI